MSTWAGRMAVATPRGIMTDRLGSVIGLTNGSGTATDTIVYDGFGNITSESNSTNGGSLKFQAMYWDGPVGEYDDNARPYNPGTGTFGGMDPDGFGGGSTNLYSFTRNDPTNATDPSGRDVIYLMQPDAFLGVPMVPS